MFNVYVDKFVEEDNFHDGCDPKSGFYAMSGDVAFRCKNADDIIKEICNFVPCKPDEIFIEETPDNSGNYDFNYIEVSKMENVDGYEASETELELWKENKIKLYSAIYQFSVYEEIKRKVKNFKKFLKLA